MRENIITQSFSTLFGSVKRYVNESSIWLSKIHVK